MVLLLFSKRSQVSLSFLNNLEQLRNEYFCQRIIVQPNFKKIYCILNSARYLAFKFNDIFLSLPAVLLFLSICIFGAECWDRDWLLYPNFNYVSWSYALACFATLGHIIAAWFLYFVSLTCLFYNNVQTYLSFMSPSYSALTLRKASSRQKVIFKKSSNLVVVPRLLSLCLGLNKRDLTVESAKNQSKHKIMITFWRDLALFTTQAL